MGVCNSPDIYQENVKKMFHGFEFTRAYINDLLIITKGDWSNQLEKLELTLQNLEDNRLKYKIKKSLFGQTRF